jgi:hypothetical protein
MKETAMNPQQTANSEALVLAHALPAQNPLLQAGEFVYGTALNLCHVLLRVVAALLLIVAPLIAFALAIMFFDFLMAVFHEVQRLLA